MRRLGWTLAVVLGATAPAALAAQVPAGAPGARVDSVGLSLDEAVRRALGQSEEIRLARSQVELAETQVREARSGIYPQVNANVGYTRTFASSFSGGGGFTLPDSLRFEPGHAPLRWRSACATSRRTPRWRGWAGWARCSATCRSGRRTRTRPPSRARSCCTPAAARARRCALPATTARCRGWGWPSSRPRSSCRCARRTCARCWRRSWPRPPSRRWTRPRPSCGRSGCGWRAGRASELEVLRAEVSRDNLRPQLVQAQNAAQLASLDLKRLVDIPLNAPLILTTPLDVPTAEAAGRPRRRGRSHGAARVAGGGGAAGEHRRAEHPHRPGRVPAPACP